MFIFELLTARGRSWSLAVLTAALLTANSLGIQVATAASALATYTLSAGWATFGLVLPQGAAPSGVQVGSLQTQVDVKTRWADGSIRFAVVSVQVPSAGSYPITAAAQQTGSFTTTWPTAATHFVINGQDWVATLPPATTDLWLSGPLVRESRAWATPMLNGTPHPSLRVIFDVRSYLGGGHRVDVTAENALNVSATNQVTYNASVVVNGVQGFTYPSAVHGSFARWRKVFATGGLIESAVTPDFTPFQQAQAIPTWIPTLANPTYSTPSPQFDILHLGALTYPIGTTGGRPEIGPYPAWAGQYVVYKSASQKDYLLRQGDIAAGAWSVHYRETDGSMVTVDKKPIFWSNRPNCGCDGVNGPANNGVGQTYPIEPGSAHHASLAYLPYLITGDRYYLEEVQFWANAAIESWDWQRNGSQGLITAQNIRGVGWGLRNLVDAATSTPDSDPLKGYFTTIVNNNLVAADARASSLADLNGLGAVWIGDQGANTLPIWQTAYLAWAITHAHRNGFTAGGLWARDRMAQFQLALFTHEPEYPRDYAAPYYPFVVKATPSPGVYTPFSSFGEMWAFNFTGQPVTQFAGSYGPEARLHLMIGLVNGWPGAPAAYNWLMAWSSPTRGTMVADLQNRSQYGLDVSSMGIGAQADPPTAPTNFRFVR